MGTLRNQPQSSLLQIDHCGHEATRPGTRRIRPGHFGHQGHSEERMIARLLRRLLYFLNRRKIRRELDEEMAAHLEMMPEERRSSFGAGLRLREDARQVWVWTWLDQLLQDLVYAARTFR